MSQVEFGLEVVVCELWLKAKLVVTNYEFIA
jgi:hypothetical protein